MTLNLNTKDKENMVRSGHALSMTGFLHIVLINLDLFCDFSLKLFITSSRRGELRSPVLIIAIKRRFRATVFAPLRGCLYTDVKMRTSEK